MTQSCTACSAHIHSHPPFYTGGYHDQMSHGANNILGPVLLGVLLGGLAGSAATPYSSTGPLLGVALGALLGHQIGTHQSGQYAHHHHHHHTGACHYPPTPGHHWGTHNGGNHIHVHLGRQLHHDEIRLGRHHHHYHNQDHQPQHRSHFNRGGELCQEGGKGKPIEYTTSGGYTVEVDKHTIKITDPCGNELKHWGDPHENLNGTHIKDWEGKQRSILLDDGTKISMSATGPHGVTETMSIYDGNQNVQIDNRKNEVTHHSFNPWDTHLREVRQHDGETAVFRPTRDGGAEYYNVYTEDKDFNVTRLHDALGRIGGNGRVHDLYDDPRLSKT